jgi:SAM-dependent methyltransferase
MFARLKAFIKSLIYSWLIKFCTRIPQADAILAGRMDKRTLAAALYLQGEGLEIGALNNPLCLPRGVRVRYVDRAPFKELQRIYPELKIVSPDIVDNGETLLGIADSSIDFIVAAQVLEHCADPISTIRHFLRVVRAGGVLYLTLPDKRYTFDRDRPLTPFAHLLRDYREGPEWSTRSHFEEAMRYIIGLTDEEEIERHVERDMRVTGHTHYHVWNQTTMLEMILGLKTIFDFEIEAFIANPTSVENIIILRKGEGGKDRRTADESLAHARDSYRQRYAGLSP